MRTLVVNHSFEPIDLIEWEKAIYLLVTEKAESVLDYDRIIRSVSQTFKLPKVIRLKRYVRRKIKQLHGFRKEVVFDRDNWICGYCSTPLTRETATIDHVIPRAQGGPNTYKNTVASCSPCNAKKGNRTPAQAGMKLRINPTEPVSKRSREISKLWRIFDEFMAELNVY